MPPTEDWQVTEEDIAQAIKQSSNTAPGPDGIPCRAWRALGNLTIDILHGVSSTLTLCGAHAILKKDCHDEGTGEQHLYNVSTLVCLTKKAAGAG